MAIAVARAVVAFHLVKLAGVAANLVMFPTLRPQEHAGRPQTSLLVPARDEGRRLRAALAGMRAQDVTEILVLDDQSRRAASRCGRATRSACASCQATSLCTLLVPRRVPEDIAGDEHRLRRRPRG